MRCVRQGAIARSAESAFDDHSMTATSSAPASFNTTWPKGSLRSFESPESIAAKLAVFNYVPARRYESVVYACDVRQLARLLREPLSRVRTVDYPGWWEHVEQFIARSHFVSASDAHEWRLLRSPKYCPRCVTQFYHSWIHNLPWMERCFVHHESQLEALTYRPGLTALSSLVKELHSTWQPRFTNYVRQPHNFEGIFTALSNRSLSSAGRALAALFEPSSCEEEGAARAQSTSFAADAAGGRALDVLRNGLARTPAALVRAAVTVSTGTPDHLLNRIHGQALTCQGSARVEQGRQVPEFWAQLAHVLADWQQSAHHAQRFLLQALIARLSRGHETCLEALVEHIRAGGSYTSRFDNPESALYAAYHLRDAGVCPRLVTFDLLTRMLRPPFLCGRVYMEAGSTRPRVHWVHAACGPVNILASPEWRFQPRIHGGAVPMFPAGEALENFARHLLAVEWAFFRAECQGAQPQLIVPALEAIVNDLDLAVVMLDCSNGETKCCYLAPASPPFPDWGALVGRHPTHASSSSRALLELLTQDRAGLERAVRSRDGLSRKT